MNKLVKISLTLIILFIMAVNGYGQNLVPNPSFEDTVSCPQFLGTDVISDWTFYRGTPDYFHNCSALLGYNNSWGYQLPRSGEAYVGLLAYHTSIVNSREHIGVQLTNTLSIGTKYYISYYVSVSYNAFGNNLATNKLGALVTMTPYSQPNGDESLSNSSTIYTDSIIKDTTNWIKVSGSFIADSSYNYLSLGVFFDDNNIDTNYIPNQNPANVSLYYIDDVCLSDDSSFCVNWTSIKEVSEGENLVNIYPNPIKDVVQINSNEEIKSVYVFNSIGQMVFSNDDIDIKKYQISLTNQNKGFYFIKVKTNNHIRTLKILLTN